MSSRWWLAAAAVVGLAACIDLSTDPDEIVAIEFTPLAWPSVVAGDTLRDPAGAAALLHARIFAGDGDEVPGAPVEFIPEDDRIRIVDGNLLVAEDTANGIVRLRASTVGVQSIVRQVDVVRRPDSLATNGTVVELEWVIPDNANTNTSVPIGASVLSFGDDTVGVRAWIVSFELQSAGVIVAPGDTSGVYLVGDNGRSSYVDTTGADGVASRRVRVRISPGFTPPESVVVTITASYRGVPLLGAPLTRVLPLRPR